MPGLSSSFVFAACNRGSEPSLKAEIARLHGGLLAPAYMRPQLVTWKSREPLGESFSLGSVFARASGLSLGRCSGLDELKAKAGTAAGDEPFHLHVFPREFGEDGITGDDWNRLDIFAAEAAESLRAAGLRPHLPANPAAGDLVLDVLIDGGVASISSEDPHFLLGIHRHTAGHSPLPGGLPRAVLPPDVPSRAFLKMEQALARAGLDVPGALAGQTALDLGCAPGGASYSLLLRGMKVFGVDTGRMDERVLHFSGGGQFIHFDTTAGGLAKLPLPAGIDLLVSDLNLAPAVALKYIESIQRRMGARILILTLKMNDRETEERIPGLIERIAAFARGRVIATQLPANRREVCVIVTPNQPAGRAG